MGRSRGLGPVWQGLARVPWSTCSVGGGARIGAGTCVRVK